MSAKATGDNMLAGGNSAGEQVLARLERLIAERQLRPGDRLPSERELAEEFGVSRTIVREAVHALVARDLLEVRPGSGAVVRLPSRKSVTQSVATFMKVGHPQLGPAKIFQVRRALEVEVAGIAALSRTHEDLARLESLLALMPQAKHDQARYSQIDVQFHNALAEATHNELFVLLNESIMDILFEVRTFGTRVPGSIDRSIRYHHDIFRQVQASDPAGARQAMLEHLGESEVVFVQALRDAQITRSGDG